jgi:hypothetical protein
MASLSVPWTVEAARRRALVPALLLGALAVGAATALDPLRALGACAAAAIVVVVWLRPAVAAYLIIGVTPLTAGIDRGLAIPLLRPSEAVAALVGGALAARGVVRWRTGRLPRVRLDRVELAILLMAVTSSVVPTLWMAVRHREITHDDLLYALVMWKYLAVYAVIRLCITEDSQVRRCLWISLGAAGIVATVAILQSLGLFGVPALLARYYAPFGHTGAWHARGSSTLALPAATADLLVYNLAIARGLWRADRRYGLVLSAMAALFVLGTLSAGEFSSAIGLLVGVVALAAVTSSPKLLLLFIPAGALGSQVLKPVIGKRLAGFQSTSGLPASWTGRLANLRTYFWPNLFSDWNFLLGVRPSARVPVAYQATGYVWIESGYTWLLWAGGIPLLASFLFFVQAALSAAWRAARRARDAASAAAVATFVAVVVTTVLMAFDPHLTYRGSADALFSLFALAGLSQRRTETAGGMR